jgi:hypothetical protein
MSKKKERVAYGYKSNRSFIEDSYKLLEKLSEKGLWNKDTLVIGLDKSVRPLAYTMRKLSKEEGREVPEIRYFNYSRLNPEKSKDQIDNISSEILGNIKGKGLENYKKIVILDEYVLSGNSVEGSKAIFEKVFPRAELYSAVLSKDPAIKTENKNLIYANTKLLSRAKSYETGIEDASEGKSFLVSKSISKNEKENYKMFVQNRKQLSRDINSYLHGKHPATIKKNRFRHICFFFLCRIIYVY